jgi:hypothetical protein
MIQPTTEQLNDPVVRRELDGRMIMSPDDWPQWPALPLKPRPPRKGKTLTEACAFVYWPATEGPPQFPLKVGLGAIFGGPRDTRTYDSLDALLDDWTVD